MGAVPPWTPEAELPFLSSVARESSFAPSTRRIFLRVPSPTRYPLGPAEQSRRKKVSTTMRGNLFLFALLALFALAVTAQDVVVPRAAATTVASIVDPENQAQPTSTAAGSSDSTSTGSSGADSAAGAEGADDGSFKMSKGGMIAIIVVVVVVAVGGSKLRPSPSARKHILTCLTSRFNGPLLHRQEAPMGSPQIAEARLSPPHRPQHCWRWCSKRQPGKQADSSTHGIAAGGKEPQCRTKAEQGTRSREGREEACWKEGEAYHERLLRRDTGCKELEGQGLWLQGISLPGTNEERRVNCG